MTITQGKSAPPFKAKGSDGKTYTNKDFKGKRTVLYFYPRDNTPGCTKEACGFRDSDRALQKLGVTVVGVSPDSLEAHSAFRKEHTLPFLLLSDPERTMMETYGAWGEKVLYGKRSIGTIRSTVVLDEEGRVVKHWKKVPNAEKHPQQVVRFIEEWTRS
jgi:peroxiredoxin Q/BCP